MQNNMDKSATKIKEIRKLESGINQNLFMISAVVTLVTMVLMSVNFFYRGSFLPTNIGFFYLTVVIVYSLHKEFLRWLGEKKSKHQGEYFVYAWIILTTALYAVNFFSNGYFSYSKEGYAISTLADVAYTTIEVLVIFIATRIMKIFFLVRK
jgi:cation transport ATPase